MSKPSNILHRLAHAANRLKEFLTAKRSFNLTAFRHQTAAFVSAHRSAQHLQHSNAWTHFLNRFQPIWFANFVRNILIVSTILLATYTYIAIDRLPPAQVLDRSAQLYQFQDVQKAAKLFGQKEIDLSSVHLKGFISNDASTNGFAIFEVNGKSSGAIAVGEAFDQGYFLKSINEDSVEIVYQGKQYKILMYAPKAKGAK